MAGRRERFTFGRRDMRRIAKVVRDVERGDRDQDAASLRTSDDGTEIVRCTFTGTWQKGETKTVTHATITSQTYPAKNYFAELSQGEGGACAIAYVGGEWILIAAEC